MEFKYKTPEEVEALSSDELKTYLESKKAHEDKEIENKISKAVTEFKEQNEEDRDEALKKLEESLGKEIANQIADMTKVDNKEGLTLAEELKAKKEDIQKLQSNPRAEVVVKADTLRASVANNAQTMELDGIGQLAHAKLTAYDIFPKIRISESNNNGTITYYDWDEDTVARAAAAVAEGGTFPESTAKWKKGTLTIQKIGDSLPVSEEFYEDEAMFASEINMFLETNVKIKRNNDLVNADGTGNNIKGIVASVDAYTPVAAGITDASIYDLLVKVKESIVASKGGKYTVDFAMMNLVDINKMKLKKDDNNNYIIPPFVDRNGNVVDGITVLEENAVTANTMILGDSRFAKIYEKVGLSLSKGYTGDQFVEDMETLKIRTRLAFLIREADKGGFAKVTSISAALTTLAS